MKIGDVLLNLYASESNPIRVSVVTYIGPEKSNTIYPYKGKIHQSRYYTRDLKNDTEHFKVIGHISLLNLLEDAIANVVSDFDSFKIKIIEIKTES